MTTTPTNTRSQGGVDAPASKMEVESWRRALLVWRDAGVAELIEDRAGLKQCLSNAARLLLDHPALAAPASAQEAALPSAQTADIVAASMREHGVVLTASGYYWASKLYEQGVATGRSAPSASVQQGESPSEKQKKLMELADRIDHEELWRWAGMDHHKMTPEQQDCMNAGVALRRYARLWAPGRWLIFPPVGPVNFSASTLDKVYEMAKKDEDRAALASAQPKTGVA